MVFSIRLQIYKKKLIYANYFIILRNIDLKFYILNTKYDFYTKIFGDLEYFSYLCSRNVY